MHGARSPPTQPEVEEMTGRRRVQAAVALTPAW